MGNVSLKATMLLQELLADFVEFVDDRVVMHRVAPRSACELNIVSECVIAADWLEPMGVRRGAVQST
jgi:hypothetical protein